MTEKDFASLMQGVKEMADGTQYELAG